MFARAERLSRSDFEHYFKTGTRSNTPHLTLLHTTHNRLHVSVVVGKKVQKKAHDRNRLRRRVYSKMYAALKGAHVGVFIVIVRPSFAVLSKQQQLEEVQKLLSRITMSST